MRITGLVAGSMTTFLGVGLPRRLSLPGIGSDRIVRAALHMLPPEIQMAVEAALREDQPRPRVPAPDPPYVFVVRHDQSQTFKASATWRGPGRI